MKQRYVWLICAAAVTLTEVLSAIALRYGWVAAEALHSTRYTLYLVAGVGAGRLAFGDRVVDAVKAGGAAGLVTGTVGGMVYQARWLLRLETNAGLPGVLLRFAFLTLIAALTAGTMGLLGGIAGWGVRRAVEPAA